VKGVAGALTLLLLATPVFAAPKLGVSLSPLEFTDTTHLTFEIRNDGDGELRWTVASPARWLRNGGRRLTSAPIGNANDANGLAAGAVGMVKIESDPAALKLGLHESALTITSNGGTVSVPVRLNVTRLHLAGTWVGALGRPQKTMYASPALVLSVEQNGDNVRAQIDGRRSPAFATIIARQPGPVEFERAEGSEAVGAVDVTRIADLPLGETWTLTALADGTFDVVGGATGRQGVAVVDEPFTSAAGGLTFVVRPSQSGRPYRAGDRIRFEVARFGAVPEPLTGMVSGEISGTFSLAGKVLGWQAPVQRVLRLSNLTLSADGVLDANWRLEHRGLNTGRDVMTPRSGPGTVHFVREE